MGSGYLGPSQMLDGLHDNGQAVHWGAALCRSALQTASNPQADVWLKAGFCGGKSGPAFVRDFLAWVKAVAAAFDSVLQSTPQLRSVLSGDVVVRALNIVPLAWTTDFLAALHDALIAHLGKAALETFAFTLSDGELQQALHAQEVKEALTLAKDAAVCAFYKRFPPPE